IYSDRTRRYLPLCDTLIGSFGDFLNWCGQANDTGFNYDSCPNTEECENNAVESFWKIASITYAKQSSGVIYVMLNGSAIGGAYPVKGFFADYEVPNFQKDRIARIEIWVMDDIGGPDLDSCGRGSVQILEERLKTMGYDITCIDNYKPGCTSAAGPASAVIRRWGGPTAGLWGTSVAGPGAEVPPPPPNYQRSGGPPPPKTPGPLSSLGGPGSCVKRRNK
uniref:ADP-ribosyl cyclase/cyclic ADP-ribose hydrolase n=1 Tax=Chelonoidis abingdonii TaxID=106734 RepID=A0A8C0G043_CHEAB